jgi:protein kinase X
MSRAAPTSSDQNGHSEGAIAAANGLNYSTPSTSSTISSSLHSSGGGSSSSAVKYDERSYFQAHDEVNNHAKLDQLEFLTTVGTGTFGRVIVVKHKKHKDYYALKIMSITEVLRLKQTDHVKNEKEILLQVKHPFIISLYWTTHNDKFLYMLLEYVCGGELFSYLRNAVKFPNDTAVFFAAEIVSALEYLHSLSIIYRDLKPENLLLDQQGHVRICDFGFAKKVHDRYE